MTRDFLFSGWPYLAFAIFTAGLLIRLSLNWKQVGSPDSGTSRPFTAHLWPLSLALLALAHLGGLLFPEEILRWNLKPVRLYLLEGTALTVGAIVLCAWVLAACRYLVASGGTLLHHVADSVFLACFFLETISGLLTAILYRWASSWAAFTLTPYVRSLIQGRPEVGLATGLPFVAQLHLFPAFVMLAVFPFTEAGTRMAGAAVRSFAISIGPAARASRSSARFLRRRYNFSFWIWPEEED